jgi:ABC-2 type transport system permease protein
VETILLGDIMSSFIFGVAITMVPLTVGFAMGVRMVDLVMLTIATLLGAFCFSAMGVLLSTPPWNAPSNVMMLSNLIKFPLIFISGVFIPLDQIPAWGQLLSFFSPITYLADLARHSIIGIGYLPIAVDLAALSSFTAAFFGIAVILHKRNMPKRL